MKNTDFLDAPLSRQEKLYGTVWMLFEILLFSRILHWLNGLLPTALPETEINFIFFAVNFTVVVLVMHGYIREQFLIAKEMPGKILLTVLVGFFAYWMMNFLVSSLILVLDPEFYSINDNALSKLVSQNYGLMFFGTVFLVPITEECLFRGVVFRGIYDRSPWLAWILSVGLFAIIHLLSYIGAVSPVRLLLCLIQYIPAGICLAASYRLSGSLFSPILIHAIVNLVGMMALR